MAIRKQEFDSEDDHIDSSKKRSRITFDVNPELRRRIKLAALQRDLSVGEYLGNILEQAVPQALSDEASNTKRQRQPISQKALENLLQFREKLMRETNEHVFADSAEILRREREKRTRYLMGEDVYE